MVTCVCVLSPTLGNFARVTFVAVPRHHAPTAVRVSTRRIWVPVSLTALVVQAGRVSCANCLMRVFRRRAITRAVAWQIWVQVRSRALAMITRQETSVRHRSISARQPRVHMPERVCPLCLNR